MEPEYVAEEMECRDGVNSGEEIDVGNVREKMDVGNVRVEMDGGNGQEGMDGENHGREDMDATDGGIGAGTGKKGPRKKHKCPYVTCNASVIHLPRHMSQVHEWSKDCWSKLLDKTY